MRCVVTGGAGFLGSHLVERLVRDGHEVRILDVTGRSDWSPYASNIRHPIELGSCDWVFHCAGLAAILPSLSEPVEYMRVNMQGTVHVLEAARRAGASRLIYAASGTCYGFLPPQPTPETAPIVCETPYALSKWLGEEAVRHWAKVYGLPAVSLRLFGPFGPRMRAETSGIGTFLGRRRQGLPIEIAGDGTQTRDWVYVDDVVEAFVRAAEADLARTHYWAINIGSGVPHTLNELVALFECPVTYGPARREAPGTWADIALAKRLLGWEPQVGFEEGVRRMLAAG